MENNRVSRILNLAAKHNLPVAASEEVPDCWTIKLNDDQSLFVYAGKNHTCSVYLSTTSNISLTKMSQRSASFMIAQHGN